MAIAYVSRFRLFLGAFAFCCIALSHRAYGLQRYDTCKVYQFLDDDSSYLETIAIKEFSGGRLVKEYSVADLEHNDSYVFCKQLKGTKVFSSGDNTKLKEIQRSYFVTTDYSYNKGGMPECAMRTDEMEGIFSNENTIYQYGQGGRLARKYELGVWHDLIQGVNIATYAYDGNGRLISDSAADDRRLVVNYQWDEDKNRLVRFDNATMNFVPASYTDALQLLFQDTDDTVNRRREVKKYRYFDGGYETQSSTLYYFSGTQQGVHDSVFLGKNGAPVKYIRRYEDKLQFVKSYYYNSNGDLVRTVTNGYEGGGAGRITRIYKYLTKKAGK